MNEPIFLKRKLTILILASLLVINACQSQNDTSTPQTQNSEFQSPFEKTEKPNPLYQISEQQTNNDQIERPVYDPGQLVDYIAQSGDSLPSVAAHFHTTIGEILEANPIIPEDVSTLPPGLPMKIPIYYQPLWGTSFQILPDSRYVNGPLQSGFDIEAYVNSTSGWLKEHYGYVGGRNRNGAEIVDYVSRNFSIGSRFLLALLEFQSSGLSDSTVSPELEYHLGYHDPAYKGLYLQLVWAANSLNHGYYGWRSGNLSILENLNGMIERPDPWQNGATVALHYFFSQILSREDYLMAISPNGFILTLEKMYGDPWEEDRAHIPGSLKQPEMLFPFESGKTWSLTGGPHTGWGKGEPFAAVDFAPPSAVGGCVPSSEWVTAVADGVVVRSETGILNLDLDGDGDEHTGWVIFYLHIATEDRAPLEATFQAGDPIGHPSCEGGTSTGTHIHVARKYNGEWIPAGGTLAFNFEGWVSQNGEEAYKGTLVRYSNTVIACECSNQDSLVMAGEQ